MFVFAVIFRQLPGGGGRESQRLVGYARLLAELYNYSVVGSPTVFETLHLLLDSGHEVRVDTMDAFFRHARCGGGGGLHPEWTAVLLFFRRFFIFIYEVETPALAPYLSCPWNAIEICGSGVCSSQRGAWLILSRLSGDRLTCVGTVFPLCRREKPGRRNEKLLAAERRFLTTRYSRMNRTTSLMFYSSAYLPATNLLNFAFCSKVVAHLSLSLSRPEIP